tara:strand:+ start:402 stop:641 length:240 start_codon:yes stop_codon:yes gene_type:complete
MDFIETNPSSTSTEINTASKSGRDNSNNLGVYNILFPSDENEADQNMNNKISDKGQKKIIFGNVSTLEWLVTWRSLEIS